jgi:hypothetical protein
MVELRWIEFKNIDNYPDLAEASPNLNETMSVKHKIDWK